VALASRVSTPPSVPPRPAAAADARVDRASAPSWPGSALRPLDGDTLLLPTGERLRLDGLDTPETGRPSADDATAAVRGWLARGRWELRLSAPPRDVYGRLLGTLVADDGRELGALLLDAGLAWVYRDSDPARLALQADAVTARRGVHAVIERLPGPFLVSATSFHRPDCALVRTRGRELPWAASAAPLLKAGRAPCRRCLRWPPRRAAVH